MAIPSQRDIELPLLQEIESSGGQARPSDLYDRVARRFPQLTQDDMQTRYPRTGQLIWPNKVQWARNQLVQKGEVDSSTRGLWKITDRGRARLGLGSPPPTSSLSQIGQEVKVRSAKEATEIAVSFIKKYRSFARPLKAVREGDFWLVDIDVGPIFDAIAKIKIDAKSGDILEYNIPS